MESLIGLNNEKSEKVITKIQAIYKSKKVRELVEKAQEVKNRIQVEQNYGELELIKQEIDRKIDNRFRPNLHRLVNKRQEELSQAFTNQIILGVSIPTVFLVIFVLISRWKQFKWWVKIVAWWNKPFAEWAKEEEENE